MKKLMHILFLSCLKATELIEKNLHVELSWRENLQLKVHKMMCSACNNYEKQSKLIDKGLEHINKKKYSADDVAQLKMSINRKLNELK
ncbi:MAG: hypothetical protein MI866_09445 [Bacteroidales bacterium]|nr:hypothetical protein [Bacteroidales bacterium]